MIWISAMTGANFERVRPARMRWTGLPTARERAVCAPRPDWEGPVMRTGLVSEVKCEEESEKAEGRGRGMKEEKKDGGVYLFSQRPRRQRL
jgi:hypothetical protein